MAYCKVIWILNKTLVREEETGLYYINHDILKHRHYRSILKLQELNKKDVVSKMKSTFKS
jgi:hypothetical protein